MNESNNQTKTPHIDYDGLWKRIIELFFKQFVEFFMPELSKDVDFSKPPEFLEQELATIMAEQTAKGRMSVDKLLKIPMKNGEYEHIFLHVEVQSQRKADFLKRNFKYFYRIFDRKDEAITAFVIYTHDDVPALHDRYVYSFRGTELTYKFNTYLVRDADEKELLKSNNIFALVILACKYANRTKNDIELRRKFKLTLFRLASKRGYSFKTIKGLFKFIIIIMYLPIEIEKEFKMEAIKKIDKSVQTTDEFLMDYFHDVFVELWGEEVIEKVTKQVKAEVTEEQLKARIESIRKLVVSNVYNPTEIADIMGVSVEEVLKIKAKIDTQK